MLATTIGLQAMGFDVSEVVESSLGSQVVGCLGEKSVDDVLSALEFIEKHYRQGLAPSYSGSPLQSAMSKDGALPVVEWLLNHSGKAYAAAADQEGNTVLSRALHGGGENGRAYAEVLLDRRSDWNLPTDYYTILDRRYGADAVRVSSKPEMDGFLDLHSALEESLALWVLAE